MKCLKTILPVVGLLLSSLALPQLALAADCTVENGDNDGAGSLRDCIDNVAVNDGDVVTIPANLTINLSGNTINISPSIHIRGAGVDSSIIDGSAMDDNEIFYISAENKPAVEMKGLTVQNGQESAIIVSPEAVLKVSDSTFQNNKADTQEGLGGAIANGGTLFIDNCDFIFNEAENGGGAIYSIYGNLNIKNSRFRANTAKSIGGAIDQESGVAEILASNFQGNSTGEEGCGGAIGTEGTLYIEASELNSNEGYAGGAICGSPDSLIEIKNSRLNGNTAYYIGGGIDSSGQVLLENSELSENKMDFAGGGISSGGDLIIKNSSIRGNKPLDSENDFSRGGAISIEGSDLVIENSSILDNEAFKAAGIDNCSPRSIILNSTLANNKAVGIYNEEEATAGAIDHACGGDLLISNSTISGNQANGNAAGIATTDSGSLVLNNVTISNNIADANEDGNGAGGGIYNLSGAVSISNSILAGNQDAGEQDNSGPDCYTSEESFILAAANNIIQDPTGCTIEGNVAGVMNVDPLLDPKGLQDNGGLTQTIALSAGSPALDAGDDGSCELADQRGVSRPQGASCDLGAYEAGPMAELAPDLNFGEVELDTESNTQIVTLTNTGLIPIDVNDITIDGDFSQSNNCGATLDAGASCQFEVTFSPTETGERTGSLSVDTSAGLLTVSLTGIGIEAPVVPNLVDVSGSGILSCGLNPSAQASSGMFAFLTLGVLALAALRIRKQHI